MLLNAFLWFIHIQSANLFLFCPLCPVKCFFLSYLTGGSRKEKTYFLCGLCDSSEAGGENILSPTRIAKLGPSA
jgi:hypothetical protein